MQELGRKTNQQKTHRRSSGAHAFDQHVETVWRAAVCAAPTAAPTPSALAAVPVATPLSPARAGLGTVTAVTACRRTGPESAVINVTPGTVT
jgi:hypothetical protein